MMIMPQTLQTAETDPVQDPTALGVRRIVAHYTAALFITERGRWTVLLSFMIALLDQAIYSSAGFPPIGQFTGSQIEFAMTLWMNLLFAWLLTFLLDTFEYAYHSEQGGDES